ncbi:MAG: (d)CMP kinase [Betaproteobacteria bacterium]|jgi:cytidylate kinase|nr:(d)CMP kinase [Pseudomonadota bacterium]NBO03312.1 (d)CMP kinase [Betaproteobacteria bacterium]HAB47564.1 (d)CMP kinase [Lautropia sp.]NBP35449.1 (d)CMP kinase [Betaproteobacteria bacterium]NBP39696.1 (d)CMP kinase [Betaproteobacteria bacterium]
MTKAVPVLTVDGPTASGKGTLSRKLASALNFHYLDSGALYRLLALHLDHQGINPKTPIADQELEQLASLLPVIFYEDRIVLEGQDVTDAIREERVGSLASEFAAKPAVRRGLLQRQWTFRSAPGLVADGRDMGTVVFPDAALKVFLVADVEERARRRTKQLIEKGISVNFDDLLADLRARDARDQSRDIAPLTPASDARLLDGSFLSISESVQQVLQWWMAIAKIA